MANNRVILHVIDSLTLGGAEMLLVNFIQFFKQTAPESKHYLVALDTDTTLLSRVNTSIEEYKVIPFSKKNILSAILVFRKFVKKVQPQVVHSHLFYSTILARCGTPKKIPVFSTYHNNSYCKSSPYFSPWFSRLDRITFRRNYYRIYVSHSVQNCVEKTTGNQNRGFYVPNFVGAHFYPSWKPNLESGVLKLVAVGNLKKVKNHSVLIEALKLIRNADILIDIYGEGELRSQLEGKIKAEKVQVHLKGSQAINSELLIQYDAFILPSLSEGQPISLLEAMATGLPCVLANIPPLIDVAADSAVYFDPVSPKELSQRLMELALNKQRLHQLSVDSLKCAQPYSISKHYNQISGLYDKALINI